MAGFADDAPRGDVYFVKLKTKAEEGYGFEAKKALGGNQLEDAGTHHKLNDMSLNKIEWNVGEYQGNPINSFKMYMRPNGTNELYIVSCSMTQVSRGILNKLFGLVDFGNIDISTFMTNFEVEGGEKIDVIMSGMKSNGEKVTGKYDFKEVFASMIVVVPDPVTNKPKKYFHKVDAQLKRIMERDLIPAIKNYNDSMAAAPPVSETIAKDEVKKNNDMPDLPPLPEEDDLPF